MPEQIVDKRIIPGTKFFRYIDGKEDPDVVRIFNINTANNEVKYYDENNKKQKMPYEELISNYKMLRPDGIIMFSIVELGAVKDVIVSLQSFSIDNCKFDKNLPYCVCRQSVYDFFSNMTKSDDSPIYHVGVSVSQDTCPADINFRDMLSCTNILDNRSISIYLDDHIEDILRYINPRKYNEVLRILKQSNISNYGNALGYCETLKELLISNNFMYDFRRCFGIMEIPFTVDEESEGLSLENILYMENEIKANIMETYLIRYTREIDLRTIKRDYKLVTSSSDKYDKVYIVGYDKSDNDYVPRQIV